MERINPGLFGEIEAGTQARLSDTTWYFVSNHVNFLTMLSAGLLMSPKGYGDKYFSDALNAFPGWIPFFAGALPKRVIDCSIAEADYLFPCAAEANLAALSGRIAAIYDDGSCRDVDLPEGLFGTEVAILVPAPLPSTWLERVVFKTKEEKKKCEDLAKNTSNVPLTEFKRAISAKVFSKTTALSWPPNASLENLDKSPDLPLAVGGMMTLLYQIANMGESTSTACRITFVSSEGGELGAVKSAFEESLIEWLEKSERPQQSDIALTLFWEIVDQIIMFRSDSGAALSSMDIVLDYLEMKKESLEPVMQKRMADLLNDLRSLSGFADSTISDLLKRHPKYFSRSLILFFLRDKSSELIEFIHSDLHESDYLAAAILFAARDGWINLPLSHRGYQGMQAAVSHRMAYIAHRASASGLGLGPAPPRCIPLREFLHSKGRTWTSKQNNVALNLAKEFKWDCIHTKVSLSKGEYRLLIDGSGTHIIFPGEVKSVTTEVDPAVFMKKLAETSLPYDVENKIRSSSTKG